MREYPILFSPVYSRLPDTNMLVNTNMNRGGSLQRDLLKVKTHIHRIFKVYFPENEVSYEKMLFYIFFTYFLQ